MNEDAVRALVREIVARRLSGVPGIPRAESAGRSEWAHPYTTTQVSPLAWQASHSRYGVLSGEDAGGPCYIEPAVRCNHCGYCQSHGH